MKKKMLIVLLVVVALTVFVVGVTAPQPAMALDACGTARALGGNSAQWNFLCAMDILFSLMTGGGGAV